MGWGSVLVPRRPSSKGILRHGNESLPWVARNAGAAIERIYMYTVSRYTRFPSLAICSHVLLLIPDPSQKKGLTIPNFVQFKNALPARDIDIATAHFLYQYVSELHQLRISYLVLNELLGRGKPMRARVINKIITVCSLGSITYTYRVLVVDISLCKREGIFALIWTI